MLSDLHPLEAPSKPSPLQHLGLTTQAVGDSLSALLETGAVGGELALAANHWKLNECLTIALDSGTLPADYKATAPAKRLVLHVDEFRHAAKAMGLQPAQGETFSDFLDRVLLAMERSVVDSLSTSGHKH